MAKSQKNNIVANNKPIPVAKSGNKDKAVKNKESKRNAGEVKELLKSTKQVILIALLERSSGATIDEMAMVTGWQNHSIHGLMSGVLRKKLKLNIISEKQKHGRVYKISNKANRI
jgi:hypothetical protein